MIQKIKSNPKGQALVEFALILVILLLFIFIIIEAGRLFQGWVTVQNAARAGGRYAITGSYETDCLYDFPRCPDARVESIKDEVRRTAAGLGFNPEAEVGTPSSFDAEVWSKDPGLDEWIPDDAGGPAAAIRVRASHFMPLLTPLFRPFAEAVRVTGQVVVQAENFDQYNTTQANVAPPAPGDPGDSGGTPIADVEIKKSVTISPAVVLVGEPIDYLIEVQNNGPFFAEDVFVVDTLFLGNQYVDFTEGSSTVLCSEAGGTVTCQTQNLSNDGGPNSRASVTIHTLAPDIPGIITNTASVSTGPTSIDPEPPFNNTDFVTVTVRPKQADLLVTISDDPDPVGEKEDVIYTYTIGNQRFESAADVNLTITLPPSITIASFVSIPLPFSCNPPGPFGASNVIVCSAPGYEMGVDVSHEFVLIATVDDFAGVQPLYMNTSASVSTSTFEDPADLGNNTATETTAIATDWADLQILKTGPAEPVSVGDVITYYLTVRTLENRPANDVIVTDHLPPQVSILSAEYISPAMSSPAGCGWDYDADHYVVTCKIGGVPLDTYTNITITAEALSAGIVDNVADVEHGDKAFDPFEYNNSDSHTTYIAGSDLELEKRGPIFVNAAETLTYTIVVTNNGPETASAVNIRDILPANVTGYEKPPNCSPINAGIITCNGFGNLAPGDSVSVTFPVIAPVEDFIVNEATVYQTDLPDIDSSNNTDVITTTTQEIADVEIAKFAFPRYTFNQSRIGEPILYLLQISSLGPSPASGVVVTDTLPDSVEFSRIITVTSGVTCESIEPEHLVRCETGDLILGPTVNIQIEVTPTVPGLITNTVEVTADQLDFDEANNTDFVETTVLPADLAITKFAPATALISDTIVYTIVVESLGPSIANQVVVTDTLPYQVISPAVESSIGSCYITTLVVSPTIADAAICEIDYLLEGATAIITVTAEAALDGDAVNTVATKAIDTAPGEIDIAQATTSIAPAADLSIVKFATSPHDDFYLGELITYTLVITNNGPSVATGIAVTDSFPADFQRQPAISTAFGTCDYQNNTRTMECDLNDLASGEAAIVTVVGIAEELGTYVNQVGVAGTYEDRDLDNNYYENQLIVKPAADLAITKSDSGNFYAGEIFQYDLVVTNNGPSDAPGVVITDTLPPSLTIVSIIDDGFTCSITPNGSTYVVCTLDGDLSNGDSAPVSIEVTTQYSGTYTNSASVSGDYGDFVSTNDSDSINTTIRPVADLAIDKFDDDLDAVAGLEYTYGISVTNSGPNVAGNVIVTDTLPASTTYSTTTLSPGPCVDAGPGAVACSLGTLDVGETKQFSITIEVDPAVVSGMLLTNNVLVGDTTTTDRHPDDNSDSEPTTVVRHADLAIEKSDGDATATAGLDISYTITVTNINGPSFADGIEVLDTLPLSTSVNLTASPLCDAAGLCTMPLDLDLAPGDSFSFNMVLSTASGIISPTTLINSAEVSGNVIDENTSNDTASDTTPVIRSVDLVITKDDFGIDAVEGELFTYTISVENLGPSDASNVVVSDPWPSGTSFASATAPCLAGLPCNLGIITRDSTVTFDVVFELDTSFEHNDTMTNTASVTAAEPDSDESTNVDSETTNVLAQADLGINKGNAEPLALAGQPFTYVFTVTNNGPSDATNIVVSDTLPALFTYNSSAPDICSAVDQQVTCTIGILTTTDAPYTFTVTVDVEPSAVPVVVTNTAVVSGDQVDRVSSNDSDSVETQVERSADLEISKSGDSLTAYAGDLFTYTLTITNVGPSDASSVFVTDTLPGEATFVSSDSCSEAQLVVGCPIINLAPGENKSILITVRINSNVISGTLITNTAGVEAVEEDPDSSNNSDDAETTVIRAADLSIGKTTGGQAIIGEPFTYTLTVTNNGPSDASNVTVVDELPTGTLFITDSLKACSGTEPTITCQLGTLTSVPPTNTINFQIQVLITDSIVHGDVITNTATVSAGELDPDDTNNEASVDSTILGQADLSVIKEASLDEAVAGTTLTYTLTIMNSGPSEATGIIVADDLPLNTELVSNTPGISCNGTDPITCSSLPALGAGVSTNFTVTLSIPSNYVIDVNDWLTNTVSVSGDQADLNSANDEYSVSTPVIGIADLAISKEGITDTAVAGDIFTYTLTITNSGPSDASGIVVTDTIPVSTTFNTDSSDTACFMENDYVSCELTAPIPANGQTTVTLAFDVDPAAEEGSNVLENQAFVVDANETDPNQGNDSSEIVTTNIVRASDLVIAKYDMGVDAVAGEIYSYTIVITNTGPSNASSVNVTDTLPVSASFNSDSLVTACTDNTTFVTCPIGELAADTTFSYTLAVTVPISVVHGTELTNSVVVSGTEYDPNTGNNDASAVTAAVREADLQITKSDGGLVAVAGETFVYTLTITNTGPATVDNVIVTDTLPTDVTTQTVSAEPNSFSCADPTGPSGCNLGMLDPGDVITVTMVVDIPAWVVSGTDVLTNTAAVSGDVQDYDPTNNSATIYSDVIRKSDLDLTKTSGNGDAIAGSFYFYTLTVANVGPSNASQVTVTDTLPISTTFEPAESDGRCNFSAGIVTCQAASLAYPGNTSFVIGVKLDSAIVSGTTITNSAGVESSSIDENPINNTDSVTSTVKREADLEVIKAGPDGAVAGTTLTYTINVFNHGPSQATGIIVTDTLDTGMTYAGSSIFCNNNGLITCEIPTLEPNTDVYTFTIAVEVDSSVADGTMLTNKVDVGGVEADPESDNDSYEKDTNIVRVTDLTIDKSGNGPAVAGENYTYTITVTNEGPSDATGVIVSDTLDVSGNMSFISTSDSVTVTSSIPNESVQFDLGSLAVDQQAVFTISLAFSPAAPHLGILTNAVKVSSIETDNTLVDTDVVETTVLREMDLSLIKSGSGNPTAGDVYSYVVTITNDGPSVAGGVVITDAIPISTTLVPGSWSPEVACSINPPSELICQPLTANNELLPGEEIAFSFVINLDPAISDGMTITNTIGINSIEDNDPDLIDNTYEHTAQVARQTDLDLTKSYDGSLTYYAGTPITYSIEIYNAGPSIGTGIVFTDELPADILDANVLINPAFIKQDCEVNIAQEYIRCEMSDMDFEETILFSIVITPSNQGAYSNTAEVTLDEFDSNEGNNTATTAPINVLPAADLSISTLSPGPQPPRPTFWLTYTLSNAGPSTATGLSITMTLDVNSSKVSTNALSNNLENCTLGGTSQDTIIVCDVVGSIGSGSALDVGVELTIDIPTDLVHYGGEVNSIIYDPNPENNIIDPLEIFQIGG